MVNKLCYIIVIKLYLLSMQCGKKKLLFPVGAHFTFRFRWMKHSSVSERPFQNNKSSAICHTQYCYYTNTFKQ